MQPLFYFFHRDLMLTYFMERCNGHLADPTGVNQGERRQIKIDVEGKTVEGIAVLHCNPYCADFGLIPPDTGLIFFFVCTNPVGRQ